MSAHVLLILLNELGKRDKMRGLSIILSLFRNELNKFNNIGETCYCMSDRVTIIIMCIYRMALFHELSRNGHSVTFCKLTK